MWWFLTLWMICLFLNSMAVQARDSGGPRLVLEEQVHDSGRVREGRMIGHTFRILNKGDQPLRIKKVKPGWGCSVVSFDRSIPPGGEGKITLKVNTTRYRGNIHKTAAVYTNDPEMARFNLGIKAFVEVPISVSPSYVNLLGSADRQTSKSVKIIAGLEKPLVIEPDKFDLEGKVRYEIEEVEKGRVYVVHFTGIPGNIGRFSGFLNLKTNYRERPFIRIRIRTTFKQGKTWFTWWWSREKNIDGNRPNH